MSSNFRESISTKKHLKLLLLKDPESKTRGKRIGMDYEMTDLPKKKSRVGDSRIIILTLVPYGLLLLISL